MKKYAKALELIIKRMEDEAQDLADEVREDLVLPICLKKKLDYRAGNGTMAFFGDYRGQEVTIGNARDARDDYGGKFKYLAKIFEDALDLEMRGPNSCIGYWVDDVVTRGTGK